MNDEHTISRRTAIVGGAAALGAFALGSKLVIPTDTAFGASDGTVTQYAFWSDTTKCTDCGACVSACSAATGISGADNIPRKILECANEFGEVRYVPYSCMHCADPACIKVCPASAISKRDDGIVVVDDNRCIGCKYCNTACPFDIPRYPSGVMKKCDFCLSEGAKPGDTPKCVGACPTGALHFGDLNALLKESGGRGKKITASTGPSYLLS